MLALSGWLLAACSSADQSPTSPLLASADAGASTATLAARTPALDATHGLERVTTANVRALHRTTPLARDFSAMARIGRQGGALTIPAAGVTLVIPAGAVQRPMTITMTALRGRGIAYEFQPHGLTFAKPVELRQELVRSGWTSGMALKGGYFRDRRHVDVQTGTALIQEELPAILRSSGVILQLWHFSGYLVSMA